ncbi:phosphopantetheine-binding protein [Neopusillimonas aromaticivorans]|nr:phosphopantetheine-binding protein [Neopusillimonas aromaticivorans]WJJ92652.1 phosphopantetheine-binding protein [Neopusillimonas aromaticivorans]
MQLISRLREETGLELALIDLFATPTPEGLAQLLNSRTIPNP